MYVLLEVYYNYNMFEVDYENSAISWRLFNKYIAGWGYNQ